MKKSLFIGLIILCLSNARGQSLKFEDGDKVVMIGNSITHGGSFHIFLQSFYATRYPETRVDFINCGVSGDVAEGMIYRFEDDIMIHQPDYAFIMTGMNDVIRDLYALNNPDSAILTQRELALMEYYKSTDSLASMLKENGVKPIFMTPTIYDQTAQLGTINEIGVNDALANCADHIRQLAKRHGAPLVDLYDLLMQVNIQMQQADPTATIIGKDRVHPGQEGHLLMAIEIIKTIAPPSQVCTVEIDAKKRTISSDSLTKTDWIRSEGPLTFELLERSLPMTIPLTLEETAKMLSFGRDWNTELLKIKKLKKGNYELKIDGIYMSNFTSKQFKKGIDLAQIRNTPQSIQSQDVWETALKIQQLQGKLRVIKLVEYRHLRDYKGENTDAAKRSYLNAKNETQKHRSWYPYLVRTVDQYFELLPQEDSILEELAKARNALYTINEPVVHSYSIKSIDL
ncbi:MAG: SGNH/GDSL hydrolase family protein [Cyclobacteriaceae bacterium]